MLSNVLLHLEGEDQAKPVIQLGVQIARQFGARVRGITLVDTRSVEAALRCESAAYAVAEQTKQARTAAEHGRIHALLSRACLDAALNFDVRKACGDPNKVLPRESGFHDLIISSLPGETEAPRGVVRLSISDLCELLQHGMQPLLLHHPRVSSIRRVLLACDGTAVSSRAIRTFLKLRLFADADCRLLVIEKSEPSARAALHEMADYCSSCRERLEIGFVCDVPHVVLPPYAEKWNADLVVWGVHREPHLRRRLLGHAMRRFLGSIGRSCFLSS